MGWAIATAALACQTVIQRVLDFLVVPAVSDDLALEHFEEQAAASARRVFLFARRAVAWAHGSTVQRPALAHADASFSGARECVRTLQVAEREVTGDLHAAV